MPKLDGPILRWHGGEYIEIGGIEHDDWVASDVINVWDYETGAPRIPRTLDAFKVCCEEWLAAACAPGDATSQTEKH